jgi:uncharacterized protein
MESQSYECFDREKTVSQIASAMQVAAHRVSAAVELLDEGNTLPFIARYRKEATQGLDELQLRQLEDSLTKARQLAQRKTTILRTIDEQGHLTAELRRRIEQCDERQELEDLYLPFKPRHRTRATIARERGLQPLADLLLRQTPIQRPRQEILQPYVRPEQDIPDAETALRGACDIVAESWSEDASVRSWLSKQSFERGFVASAVRRGKKDPSSKFAMYFEYEEPVRRVPSHRFLAMKRGEAEDVLRVGIKLDDESIVRQLKTRWVTQPRFEFHRELLETAEDCYQRLLHPANESAVMQQLKIRADEEAISVFSKNLRELLLSAPAGPQMTLGIDPGFRTGCKVVVVDSTGKFLESVTLYPTPPHNDVAGATKSLVDLLDRYEVKLIAIGNGTASRETDAFVTDVLHTSNRQVTKVMVSESGASIYSASEKAAREYPDLDVTVRGAISIAHRLQDPLAELVKLDPKSIGVGQYQHDVDQGLLQKCLDREVESCVNLVGVDVNLASASLLSYVAGIGPKLAEGIVAFRNEHGRFETRKQLLKIPKLGKKAFQQAAGFLRIADGSEPLDNSAVHPESYYVVEKMASQLNVTAKQLVGSGGLVQRLEASNFVDDRVGLLTLRDILAELAKPGRDPRSEFRVVKFAEGIRELEDLKPGMILEGAISNVTRFGAFVDLGVHQDGLIHISELAAKFIQDPTEVVSVGDIVRVKVLQVDLERRRIALSRKQVNE